MLVRIRSWFLATALCGATTVIPAAAQVGMRLASSSATLPESNEAMLLSSQVENAIERADYRLAIRLIEQIMHLPAELVAAPGVQTLYPVRTQAIWLLRRLPPEGAQVFRELRDAEASARFADASAASDVAALRELFRQYPISTAWPDIGRELVGLLLDRGQYGEAIEVIRELHAGGAADSPQRRAQLAAALASIGARSAAEQIVTTLETEALNAVGTPLDQRAHALRDWLKSRSGASEARDPAERFAPAIHAGDTWQQPLAQAESLSSAPSFAGAPSASDVFRAWPLHRAALADDVLVVRVTGRLFAFDALTLAPLWSVPDITAEQTGEAPERIRPMFRQFPGNAIGPTEGLSSELGLLLSHVLRHSLAAGGGRVFSVEALNLVDDWARQAGRRGFGFDDAGGVYPNQLIARDLRTGVQLWRAGFEPTDPLSGVAFQAPPLLLGDQLLVPVQRGAALLLCALDPATGKLLRETPLIGPPTEFPVSGGRCYVLADETAVYVMTGNGIVCALGRDALDWKWATIYPNTIGERFSGQWWAPTPRSAGDEIFVAPVLADDLLVLAPVDSRDLFALDRFSGLERWRRPLGEDRYVIGAANSGLLLAGSRIRCVDAVDGKTLRWQSVPLEITGAPALRDGRIYVPAQSGLIVIDAYNGKVVDDQIGNAAQAPPVASLVLANLLVSEEAVFSVSPTAVVKYPDPPRLARQCERILAAAPADPRPQLARAWTALLTGDLPDALATLEQLKPSDAVLAGARDRLLGEVLLALAVRSADQAERLAWLRRAAELASSPDVAVRVAAMTGQTLEDAGQWSAAFAHYAALLRSPPPGLRTDPTDRTLSQASWVFALDRIRSVVPRASASETQSAIARLVEDAITAQDAAALRRARTLTTGDTRAQLDAAFVLAGPALDAGSGRAVPPELAVESLHDADPPGLNPVDARRLQLKRCEIRVSLGQAAAAEAELARWNARYAPTQGDQPPEIAAQERELLDRLSLAMKKLAHGNLPPFKADLRRQWRMQNAEFVLDPRDPLAAIRPWFVARATDQPIATLMRVFDKEAQRPKWDYALTSANSESVSQATALSMNEMASDDEARRPAWPMTVHGQLGVLPVAGGLVCVGLGPELRAGGRLWEFPVPDWARVPDNFNDRTATSASGLFFCPRGNRIVLLDWFTGGVRWQRDLPGKSVARLYVSGARLLVVTQEQEVLALDAEFGRELQSLPVISGADRTIEIVGDTILLLGEAAVVGVAADTFEKRWTEPCGGARDFVRVHGRDWFAYRDNGSKLWRLRNATDGQPMMAADWREPGVYTALHVADDVLLAAAHRGPNSESGTEAAILTAYAVPQGAQRWTEAFETSAPLNVTQLAGHPQFIPVLIAPRQEDRGATDAQALSIRLIDKHSGVAAEPVSTGNITRKSGACSLSLLVTPTRIIVQAYGNLLGFGQAASGGSP